MVRYGSMKNDFVFVLVVAVGGALLSPRAAAQIHNVKVESDPSCDSCAVSLELIAQFGSNDNGGMVLSRWLGVYALPEGRWASRDARDPGAFRFYDPSGRFTHRIDAHGEGPGEYQWPLDILKTPDGYLIYDARLGRLNWVSDDFEFLRSRPFPVQAFGMEFLPNGDILFTGISPSSAAHGHFVHVTDTAGTLKSSFGGEGRPVDLRTGRHLMYRIIEVADDGAIWTSRSDRYELVSHRPNGDTIAVLTREADWFEPDVGPHYPPGFRDPPNPRVVDIVSDDDGFLWILVHVPDPRWEDAVRDRSHESQIPEQNGYVDSVIEVIDPATGTIIARTRVPDALRAVTMARDDVGAGVLFYRLTQDSRGLFSVGVLRAEVIRQIRSRR